MVNFEGIPNIDVKESKETFDEQFESKKEIESHGAKIEFVDIQPEEESSKTPVFWAPGWGETPEIMKPAMKVTRDSGRRVLSIKHSRTNNNQDNSEDQPNEIQKAQAIVDVINASGIGKVVGVGHSEGGINILLAASLQPDKFENIILVAPGGLVGSDNFLNLVGRFLKNMGQGAKRMAEGGITTKRVIEASNKVLSYVSQNPLKAFHEVDEIANSRTESLLKELKEKGIGISIVHGASDAVFPMERMSKNLSTDLIDGFYSVKGGHNEIHFSAEKYSKAVSIAIDSLEKRAEKKKTENSA